MKKREPIKRPAHLGDTRRHAGERTATFVLKKRERQKSRRRELVARSLNIEETLPTAQQIETICGRLRTVLPRLREEGVEQLVLYQTSDAPFLKTDVPVAFLTDRGFSLDQQDDVWAHAATDLRSLFESLLLVTHGHDESVSSQTLYLVTGSCVGSLLELLKFSSVHSIQSQRVEECLFLALCSLTIILSEVEIVNIVPNGVGDIVAILPAFLGGRAMLEGNAPTAVSLRCAQLAILCVEAVGNSMDVDADEAAPLFGCIARLGSLLVDTAAKSEAGASEPCATGEQEVIVDRLSCLGNLSPIGGLKVLLHLVFSTLGNACKFSRLPLVHRLLHEWNLIGIAVRLLGLVLYGPQDDVAHILTPVPKRIRLNDFAFGPQSESRSVVTELLELMVLCIPSLSLAGERTLPSDQLATLLAAVWTFCAFTTSSPTALLANQEKSSPGSHPANEWMLLQIFIQDMTPYSLQRLRERPSDILAPAMQIVELICQSEITQLLRDCDESCRSINLLLQFEQGIRDQLCQANSLSSGPPEPTADTGLSFQRGVVVPSLLSKHSRIKQAAISCVGHLAMGRDAAVRTARFLTPILLRILADPEPQLIKQATIVTLHKLLMSQDEGHFKEVLDQSIPPENRFDLLANPVDRSASIVIPSKPCGICGRLSFIDLVLEQFRVAHGEPFHFHLLMDIVEKALQREPDMRRVLYLHGVIDAVELGQLLNDDSLFHRTVDFVARYYDDYSEGS